MLTQVASTDLFLDMATRSTKAPAQDLLDSLDPDGFHVVWMSFPHNDDSVRVAWMCKFTGRTEPVHVLMDVSFEDFSVLPTREAV